MASIRVGVAGLGKMGSAFARRLIAQNFPVSVWDRTTERASSFAGNAAAYASLDEFLSANDVIVVSLSGDEAAHDVTLHRILPAMLRTQVLVEMSTISPEMSETVEDAAHARRIGFVSAPVVGSPDVVREGRATSLASGDRKAMDDVRSELSAFGYLKLATKVG